MALPAGVSFGKVRRKPLWRRPVPMWAFATVSLVALWSLMRSTRGGYPQPFFPMPREPRWVNGQSPPATFAGSTAGHPPRGRYQ